MDCGICGREFDTGHGWVSHVTQKHRDTDEYDRACEWYSDNHPNKDGFSDEHRRKISEAKKGCEQPEEATRFWRENNPAESEEFKERMSGEGNPMKRDEVVQK